MECALIQSHSRGQRHLMCREATSPCATANRRCRWVYRVECVEAGKNSYVLASHHLITLCGSFFDSVAYTQDTTADAYREIQISEALRAVADS